MPPCPTAPRRHRCVHELARERERSACGLAARHTAPSMPLALIFFGSSAVFFLSCPVPVLFRFPSRLVRWSSSITLLQIQQCILAHTSVRLSDPTANSRQSGVAGGRCHPAVCPCTLPCTGPSQGHGCRPCGLLDWHACSGLQDGLAVLVHRPGVAVNINRHLQLAQSWGGPLVVLH